MAECCSEPVIGRRSGIPVIISFPYTYDSDPASYLKIIPLILSKEIVDAKWYEDCAYIINLKTTDPCFKAQAIFFFIKAHIKIE